MKNKSCFETIKIENGNAKNLAYHQRRVDRTRKELFGAHDRLDLRAHLNNLPHGGVHRVKIEYEKDVKSLTCREYEENREFNFFKIVHSKLSYQYKSVSYTHLRAHETKANIVCRLLLEK